MQFFSFRFHRRYKWIAAVIFFTAFHGNAMAASAPELRKVALSTGGVAYFEHRSEIEGDDVVQLTIRRDQVDDVLKSLVVFDSAGGVVQISLPGRTPERELFRDLPVGADDLNHPAQILRRLRGAEIQVSGPNPLAGRLVSISEEVIIGELSRETRHRVTVMTDNGLGQFILEDANNIRFTDSVLQDQVMRALQGLAANQRQDNRTLSIRFSGTGKRTVDIGYMVAAPIWKTSYRALERQSADAGADGKSQLQLQGWALLENWSRHDWKQVELTLLAGRPASFRQALYQSYFVERPTVPIRVGEQVIAPLDEGSFQGQSQHKEMRRATTPRRQASPGQAPHLQQQDFAVGADAMVAESLETAPPRLQARNVAQSQGPAMSLLYRLPTPVTLARGESLMVPLLERDLDSQSVAYYQGNSGADHPLTALEIVNNDAAGWPQGAVSLYRDMGDGLRYIGDGRIGNIPPGESRLLSFAQDLGVSVAVEPNIRSDLSGGTLAGGILRLKRIQRQVTQYRLRTDNDRARIIWIDHEKLPGWVLSQPLSEDIKETADAFRIPISLEKATDKVVEVILERPLYEEFRILDSNAADLAAWAQSSRLPSALVAFLQEIAAHKGTVSRIEQDIADLNGRMKRIFQDQARLRENLGRVPGDSALAQQYLDKLADQEQQIETLANNQAAAEAKLAKARATLQEAIAKARFE